MKKTPLSLVFILATSVVYAKIESNPADVERYQKTGICVSCDLSGSKWVSTQNKGALDLSHSNIIRMSVELSGSYNRQYSNFNNVIGIQLMMMGGDFSYSNFSNADLRSAFLTKNNLTGADFTGANVAGVNFNGTNLYRSRMTQEQLNSASDLCNAILPDGQVKNC